MPEGHWRMQRIVTSDAWRDVNLDEEEEEGLSEVADHPLHLSCHGHILVSTSHAYWMCNMQYLEYEDMEVAQAIQ
jgi:hypothetical protein